MEKKNNLLVLETTYSLFLYLLINSKKDTLFLMDYNFFSSNRSLINKLENYELIKFEKKFEHPNKFLSKIYWIYYYRKVKFILKKRKFYEYKNIYGLDHTLIGNFLINENFFLLEDGTKNYCLDKTNIKDKVKNFILGRNKIMGRDKRIRKIYLTGLVPVPKEIEYKVEIIDIEKLWGNKNEKEKKEILDIFNFSFEIAEKLRKKKIILFTQPLSEDKVLTEAEKIKLYKKIINNYNSNELVIKCHPREKTDYKKEIKNIEILDQNFPSELFNFLEIKFEKAVTIFSTAALTLDKNIKVDFYGSEIHPKILKKFGSMKSIMETNAFIIENI